MPGPGTLKKEASLKKASVVEKSPLQLAKTSGQQLVKRRKDEDEEGPTPGVREDEFFAGRNLLKPHNQVTLTPAQLKEEITRVLSANNPHFLRRNVRYSFKEQCYKPVVVTDQLAILFEMKNSLISREVANDMRNMLLHQKTIETETSSSRDLVEGSVRHRKKRESLPFTVKDLSEFEFVAEAEDSSKLKNQFNFCERGGQTYNNPFRNRGNQTDPPSRITFSAVNNQWIIYDSYLEDAKKLEKAKDTKEKKSSKKETAMKKYTYADSQLDEIAHVAQAAKIMERMVNQNIYDDVAQDFRYWEDASDEYRDQQGTLLPLWKFIHDDAKKSVVCALCWSPCYKDCFAVGFGSYDFLKQSHGFLCLYSLKNPSHPEYNYKTYSGVLCIDIHRSYPHLVAIGLYDGCVAVYNLCEKTKKPIYLSTPKTGKHTQPVWQVKWQKDNLDNNLNFLSLAADGRVVIWTLVKSELTYENVILLKLDDVATEGPEGTTINILGCGSAMGCHGQNDNLFIVGTEEGKLYKCSKVYAQQFLDIIQAHKSTIHKIHWNCFHENVFITCSADWTVKIWDNNVRKPLFTYDLGCSVADVAWAPYSSTIFAAVTIDGKVHFYDLNINKFESLCLQVVIPRKKTKLTQITFNQVYPILIVGDDRGGITTLKISPNLRKKPKMKKGEVVKGPEIEISKMEKLLYAVMDPDPLSGVIED